MTTKAARWVKTKKKELKKIINKLESERDILKGSEGMWKDIVLKLAEKLSDSGVKSDIVIPVPPLLASASRDGVATKYNSEICCKELKIELDFTEHDSKLIPRTAKLFE